MPSSPETAQPPVQKDLTKEKQLIRNNTVDELKLKLSSKEFDSAAEATMIPENQKGPTLHSSQPLLNEDGLIVPKKPHNPVKDNSERQNLHRELLFNQKIGKNVLNQKSELQKALDKHKENLAKKEMENQVAAQTPELEKIIADRAKRLQGNNTNNDNNEDEKVISKEFLQARMNLKTRSDTK